MPNWCENRVYIEATANDIGAIIAAVNSGSLLNYLNPQPEYGPSISGCLPEWYTWRSMNWGTKWEVSAEIISNDVEWVNLAFDSAWSPPINALRSWESNGEGRRFNIRYIEWGSMFCGEADSDGTDDYFIIPDNSADVAAHIPIDLNEEFGISDTVAQWEAE
jgi:hypothetical protein